MLERDENIQDGFNLKLISADLQSAQIAAKEPFIMTPSYFCSPESIDNILSKNQDVWASGIFLCLLLTGKLPC